MRLISSKVKKQCEDVEEEVQKKNWETMGILRNFELIDGIAMAI